MNRRLILALGIFGLLACTTTQTRIANFRDTEIVLEEARSHAFVECSAGTDCDRLWRLTRCYVEEHSVTKIRHTDRTVIETAMPHMFGALYVWAQRTADATGGSTITIKAMCRGMYRDDGSPGRLYKSCAEQTRAVETEFRPFISAS